LVDEAGWFMMNKLEKKNASQKKSGVGNIHHYAENVFIIGNQILFFL